MFEKYEKKGLVSVKTLVMKTPIDRTESEVEYLVLYLKFKHSRVFGRCDKQEIEMFIQRMQLSVYTPSQVVCAAGNPIDRMIMVMEGTLER